MGTKFLRMFRCLGGVAVLALAAGLTPKPAAAQTCLQEEFNSVPKQTQKLNCSANDVRVAAVSNVRDLSGAPLTSCIEGTTFSFVADFNIVTTANATNAGGRDNITAALARIRPPRHCDLARDHPGGRGTEAGSADGENGAVN